MKKILFIVLFIFMIIACNSNYKYNDEFIEYAKQFDLIENIDTINLVHLNAKAFQILGKYECLAYEKTSETSDLYLGNTVYIITYDMLYDNVTFDNDFVLLGTYKYTSIDSINRTVRVYASKDIYNNNINTFIAIKDININN